MNDRSFLRNFTWLILPVFVACTGCSNLRLRPAYTGSEDAPHHYFSQALQVGDDVELQTTRGTRKGRVVSVTRGGIELTTGLVRFDHIVEARRTDGLRRGPFVAGTVIGGLPVLGFVILVAIALGNMT